MPKITAGIPEDVRDKYPSGDKQCSICSEVKMLDQFSVHSTQRSLYAQCRSCNSTIRRDRWKNRTAKEIERKKKQVQEYRKEHSYSYNAENSRALRLKNVFGLSVEEFERMNLYQEGKCAICKEQETSRHWNGKVKRLSVDHCHETGEIRELLCQKCNHAIGMFRENVETLRNAIEYLARHSKKV